MFDVEENIYYLRQLSKELNVENIAKVVIDNPKFSLWSASSNSTVHHYGKYGLIKHTCEVIQLCFINNQFFKSVNKDELFLAALFHDFGKIYDYGPTSSDLQNWISISHKYKIHHIAKSYLEFNLVAIKEDFCPIKTENIGHAILAHHGLKEWGSPVEPKTKLAWLLHLCDGLSARMDDTNE